MLCHLCLDNNIILFLDLKTDNNFQEEKCLKELEQMRRCCLIHSAVSVCCSGIQLERPYSPSPDYKGFRTEK